MLTILIDGNSLMNVFYRATLPEQAKKSDNPDSVEFYDFIPRNKYGVYMNAFKLFIKYTAFLINTYRPEKLAVAFDVNGGSDFRKKSCPDYKATRGSKPTPLLEQLDIIQFWLKKCGIPVYTNNQCEADDLLYSLSSRESVTGNVMLVTTDHDYYQMIKGNTKALMYIPNRKKFEELQKKYPKNCTKEHKFCFYDENMIKAETGVYSFQIPDLKGLHGDTSDNISGVKGIGEKTAIALLNAYPSIESIYEAMNTTEEELLMEVWKAMDIPRPTVTYKALKEGEYEGRLSKWLATAWSNVPTVPVPMLQINTEAWTELLEFIKTT